MEANKVRCVLCPRFCIKPYYAHFYRDNIDIGIFKDKMFRMSTDKQTWKDFIEYDVSLGIPRKQLEMEPVRFEEETY